MTKMVLKCFGGCSNLKDWEVEEYTHIWAGLIALSWRCIRCKKDIYYTSEERFSILDLFPGIGTDGASLRR